MKTYTVHELAGMAGVTVRTLHHYDQIGLLRPANRTPAGYRLYAEGDLLRLQQILFFRELSFPLSEIRRILDDPGFDELRALQDHRRALRQRVERLERLLRTVDRTIQRIKEEDEMVSDEELYAGFSKEQRERYDREAREQYGAEAVDASYGRIKGMSKAEWAALQAEGDAVNRGLAELAGRRPDDPEVQALIGRHFAWVSHFWTPNAESYTGLGTTYAEHPEFRAFYDKYGAGLADFMRQAMAVYAEKNLR